MKKLQVFLFAVFLMSTVSLAYADEQNAETEAVTTEESAQVVEEATDDAVASADESQLPDCVAPIPEYEPLPETPAE